VQSDEALLEALANHDSAVILKAVQRQRILELLRQSGRFEQAVYLERIGREDQRIVRDLHRLEAGAGIYFSLFVVRR